MLVLGINCMTHGQFESYEEELNEYGILVPTNRTTDSMIPMSNQAKFRGKPI